MPEAFARRPWRRVVLDVLAVLLALEAARRMSAYSGAPDWSAFSVVLILACVGTQMRVRMPAVSRAASLSFPFSFAAIAQQPPLVAFLVIAGASLFERLMRRPDSAPEVAPPVRRFRERAAEIVFALASSAVGVWAAAAIYRGLAADGGVAWAAAATLSAVAYFLVVTGLQSLRTALDEGGSATLIWNRSYFWTSPIYLLSPLGVLVTELIVRAETFWDTLLGVFLIGLAYAYLRIYFPGLRNRQSHAQELADLRQRALETLAVAIEAKDGSTAGHLRRVKLLAGGLARRLNRPAEERRALQLAAVLHDVGKIGVSDYILKKPSRLTDAEFQEIATHARIGADIVGNMEFPEDVEEIILSHHEHWDGSGYPRRLSGEQIPVAARILTVVDCFDALISERPYRRALSIEEAVRALEHQRGKIFDPDILDVFLRELPAHVDDLRAQLEEERRAVPQAPAETADVRQTWVEKDPPSLELSARVRSLQRLANRPHHLSAFYELMNLLGADLQFDSRFRDALEVLRAVCGADLAALFVFSAKRGQYVLQSSVGLPTHCVGRLAFAEGIGLVGRAAMTGLPLSSDQPPYEEDDGSLPRYFERVACTLAAPLDLDGRKVGVLLLGSERRKAFDEAHGLLLSLVTEKLAATVVAARQLRRIHIDATTDQVTSLPNARASYVRLDQEINRGEREGRTVGVLFMDLNGLKPVNDSYGHAAGDKLLAETATRLRQSLRSYDFVGRVGGDEFLAILPGLAPSHVEKTRRHLKRALSSTAAEIAEGVAVRPVVSIGVALFPHDSKDPNELIELSDRRMYDDKEHSRSVFLEDAEPAGAEDGAKTAAAGD